MGTSRFRTLGRWADILAEEPTKRPGVASHVVGWRGDEQMDGSRFDSFVMALSNPTHRRAAVQDIGGVALAVLAALRANGAALAQIDDGDGVTDGTGETGATGSPGESGQGEDSDGKKGKDGGKKRKKRKRRRRRKRR